jgi:iron complex outermembrane recepter protein
VLGVSRAEQEVEYDSDRAARDLGRTDGSNTATNGSLEVRLSRRNDGPLDWLLGVYAARDAIDYDTSTHFSTDPITQSFNPFVPVGTPYNMGIGQPSDYHKQSETVATSAALFGEGTWNVDPKWALTLGLRLSYEASEMDWNLDQSGSVNPQIPNGSFAFSDDRDEFQVLPKAALAYHVDDLRMVYGSVTRGYRAGGLNANATSETSAQIEYDPEFTWNYELGWRSLWLERALAFNLTGFFIDWRDQQVFTERAPFDVIETNAERAHVLGAEAEIRWRSATGLSLWANGGLLQAEFDDRTGQEFQSDGQGGYNTVEVDYADNRFAHIPEWTWAIGGAYQHESGVFVRGDLHGHSWTYVDDKNDQRADGVALVDARLGYAQSRWSIAAVGRNLTDETDVLTSITLPGDFIYTTADSTYVRLAPSRSIGVEVSAWW